MLERAIEMCTTNTHTPHGRGREADLQRASWVGYWNGQRQAFEHVLEITKDLQLEP